MRAMTIALVLVLVAASAARAEENPEEYFAKAEQARKEGRFAAALEGYRRVIAGWPDDFRVSSQAHLRLAECLAKMGRLDEARRVLDEAAERYRDREDWVEGARRVAAGIEKQARKRNFRQQQLNEALAERARQLREEGLRDEELERALADERERLLAERRRDEAPWDSTRMLEAWRKLGVPEEEIRARVERIAAARARQGEVRLRMDREAARLKAEGVPARDLESRLAELERQLLDEEDLRWRNRHEDEMARARDEFIHLAERLGIPADAAKRFLEEHARKPRWPERAEPGPDRPGPGEEVHHRLRALETRLEHLEKSLGKVLDEFAARLHRLEDRPRPENERDR